MSRSSLCRILGVALAVALLAATAASANAATTQIENPNAEYLATTTKIDISGITNGTSVDAISDSALTVKLDKDVSKAQVGVSWATWSSPPYSEESQPHIFIVGSSTLTMGLSRPVSIFGFEVEPNSFVERDFTLKFKLLAADQVVAEFTRTVNGASGARLVALKSPDNRTQFNKVEVTTTDGSFAFGQVRYAFVAPGVVDVKGDDRYATAVAGSKAAFQDGAPAVVLATGDNFADALGGAALAGALKAPLLLTTSASLPPAVRAEIVRLKAKDVYVLGGTSAVSSGVETALSAIPGVTSVTRIAGTNRYQTAEKVAAKTIAILGSSYNGNAFVATGANFPDALGASPIAAARRMPIYLADPSKSTVPLSATVKRVWITGGTAVVPGATESALKTKLGSGNVTRVAGANRFETAAKVAVAGEALGLSWNGVGIATGANFPDALAAGPVLGARNAVMVLTDARSVPTPTRTILVSKKAKIHAVHFFGGDAAVPPGVRSTVLDLVD